jgi:hypothetical protein
MSVLIITRSDDNASIEMVSKCVRERGGLPIRLNSDRYPDQVQLACSYGNAGHARLITTPEGRFDLDEVQSIWYRRFHAGAGLPLSLGDTRRASVSESRRSLWGMIAAVGAFELDPLESVRRTDHKELQIKRAAALGLKVPRTLFSNEPAAVRTFFDEVGGRMITKMQSSFAIYREGIENVVFTNVVKKEDLEDLEGLRYCPMTFQEHVEKALELRVTVVGKKVMTAAIDSQAQENTRVDWRRDGVGLIEKWRPYELPEDERNGLLALLAELGLNYGAADFIVTPGGEHVFLEVNAVGEFFWLQRAPGLPIAESIADLLLGKIPRNSRD